MDDWNTFRKQHKGKGKSMKQLSGMYETSKSSEYKKPTKKNPSKKKDLPAYIESLPDELKLQVLSQLPMEDVIHSCQVSKAWKRICTDNYLWNQLLKRDFKKEYSKHGAIGKKFDTYVYYHKYYKVQEFLKKHGVHIQLNELLQLKQLDLSHKNLTSLPKELGNLKKLKSLILNNNNLTSIPKELGNLSKLIEIHLYDNKLTSIPKELSKLSQLTDLYLYNNNLTSIPKELGNLTSLEYFSIEHNKLTSMPKELGNLKNLKQLDIEHNKIDNKKK